MNKRIDEVMTKENIVTTAPGTDMETASDILQKNKIEKLPVVDENGKLIGLITYKDITKQKINRWLARMLKVACVWLRV